MIICRSKGFIFLRVPRTASTSLSFFLQNNIKFTEEDAHFQVHDYLARNVRYPASTDQHPNLQFLIDWKIATQQEIDSLRVYGVIREPISRTISLFTNAVGIFLGGKKTRAIESLTTNQIVNIAFDNMSKSSNPYALILNSNRKYILEPQSYWLKHRGIPISNIIVYPNFDNFLYEVVGRNDMKTLMSSPPHIENALTQESIEKIKFFYQEDFDLWETIHTNDIV